MRETFTAETDGTLLPFLFENLPEVKRTKVRQWLKFDGIQVNGTVVNHTTHPIAAGDTITLAPTAKPSSRAPLPAGMKLIHEDASILVVMKPAKLLSIAAGKPDEVTAYSELTEYVRDSDPRGRARIWIVHRLDRDTSGLMVFAKSEEAKTTLQANWKEASKKYLAVVDGVPPAKSGTLRSDLDESNPLHVRSVPASDQTREAVTHYRIVRKTEKLSVLELTLETGRKHQIRVQLAEIDCPIIGDEKYHPDASLPAAERPIDERPKRMALHAAELSIPHPETGEIMSFTSDLPNEMARMMKTSTRHERRKKKQRSAR